MRPPMNPLSGLVLLALALPLELLEEYSLLPTTPATERVSVRARYQRTDDGWALLPRAVQGTQRPEARAFGSPDTLAVSHGPEGWRARLPAGGGAAVRVLSWVERPVEPPRLFRTAWPRVRDEAVPTRRVAVVPRALLDHAPRAWTCPSEAPDEVPCVTRARVPPPLVTTMSPPPSPRWSVAFALTLTAAAFVTAAWSARGRLERSIGAAGGAAVALAVALAMVGACVRSWGPALAMTLPLGALVGAVGVRTAAGRAVGGVGLMVVPLLAVTGRSVDVVVIAGLSTAMGALAARALGREG